MFRIALIAAALVAGSAHAQDLDALKVDTRKNALPVLPKVVGMMQGNRRCQGPVEAIPVCKEKALNCSGEQAAKTGWQMRRVSLKTRNPERGTPMLGGPPAGRFQHPRRQRREDRNARDRRGRHRERQAGLSLHRAIPVGDVCLKCHGPVDKVDAGLKSQLAGAIPTTRPWLREGPDPQRTHRQAAALRSPGRAAAGPPASERPAVAQVGKRLEARLDDGALRLGVAEAGRHQAEQHRSPLPDGPGTVDPRLPLGARAGAIGRAPGVASAGVTPK